jgi:hypothetical protein
MNALTMVAAYKWRTTEWKSNSDFGGIPNDPESLKSNVWTIGGGWAIPTTSAGVFEPVLRYSRLNLDTKRDEYSNFGRGSDYGVTFPGTSPWASNRGDTTGSGDTVEIGANWYANKFNKLQLAYMNWRAEEGVGRAQTVVLQHQLTF